jgi:hypothetical protein
MGVQALQPSMDGVLSTAGGLMFGGTGKAIS